MILIIKFYIKIYWPKYKIEFILSWWEPLLYPNIYKIISFIIDNWYYVTIQTNAVLFKDLKIIEKFVRFKWRVYFFVSLHWHTKKIYNTITNSNLYDNAIIWIKNLITIFGNYYVELNIVINTFNYIYLMDYLKYINNNLYINDKIKLNISLLLANKPFHEKYLVKYTDIVNYINWINILNFKNINFYESFNLAWWYCQLPFCIFSKINYIDNDNLFKYAVLNDVKVGENIMYKWKVCTKCKYNQYCVWISKIYYKKFGDSELFCLKK